jgi:predicted metal-dependent phosphoesterase TrpH
MITNTEAKALLATYKETLVTNIKAELDALVIESVNKGLIEFESKPYKIQNTILENTYDRLTKVDIDDIMAYLMLSKIGVTLRNGYDMRDINLKTITFVFKIDLFTVEPTIPEPTTP